MKKALNVMSIIGIIIAVVSPLLGLSFFSGTAEQRQLNIIMLLPMGILNLPFVIGAIVSLWAANKVDPFQKNQPTAAYSVSIIMSLLSIILMLLWGSKII